MSTEKPPPYPFFHKFMRRFDQRCKLCGQTRKAGQHVPAALDVRHDWTARRAALRGRWSGNGLFPMTAFEMAGAVARDANEGECETCVHHDMDHYDRRGLLNLVSSLLDRIAARPAVPAALDVELIRRVTDGWYGIGASGDDWDRMMAMLREYAALSESSDE